MKRRYGLEKVYHTKRSFFIKISLFFFIFIAIVVFVVLSIRFVRNKILHCDSIDLLYSSWNMHTEEGYRKVNEISSGILSKKTFHNTALTFLGYSSFMLAEYETDNTKAQQFLDKAIFSLRVALQNSRKSTVPQIEYMLGRAYFYKNKLSAFHYYSDLVVKYLLAAKNHGYQSDDIPLLLGLSYASLGETDNSISSFTEALLVRENDTLLFNIAKQYFSNEQFSVSKQYLQRVLEVSENEDIINSSHLLLGQIYIEEQQFTDAEKEINFLLEKNENFADAHFVLGILYEKKGDAVKARSEWRNCLKIQFNHPGALKKMSETK